jgi:hypothetical protein
VDIEQLVDIDPLTRGGIQHAIAHEIAKGRLIGMLELTSSAFAEVAARRLDMVRPSYDGTVFSDPVARHGSGYVPTILGNAVTACGDAHDCARLGQRQASIAAGIACVRSSGVKAAPHCRAASP